MRRVPPSSYCLERLRAAATDAEAKRWFVFGVTSIVCELLLFLALWLVAMWWLIGQFVEALRDA